MGVERIAEMQAYKGEVNEVVVGDEGEIKDDAGHSWNLLKVKLLVRLPVDLELMRICCWDEAMLFICMRSSTMENVPTVLHVLEEIKWLRHKAGMYSHEFFRRFILRMSCRPRRGRQVASIRDLQTEAKGPEDNQA